VQKKQPVIALQSLINAQEAPAVIIDEDYRIVAANEAYCASYGVEPSQVVGRCCHDVSHHSPVPCHLNGEACPHRQVLTTDRPFEVLHTHYDRDNHPDRVRIKAYPLHDADGKRYIIESIARLATTHDISCEEMRMVGTSPALLACLENLTVAARSDAPALIYGESGVGKELAAQFVHHESRRSGNAYVELNCAAVPEALCESELFGHERGAFTGCAGAKRGLFEQADGGTLFLDEIAEMPLPMQAKLLRVLDSGEFRRIGAECARRADVRVVAATNKNLQVLVERGLFREDLYYRIAGIKVTIPPLRERREDIPVLAQVLVGRYCKRAGRRPCELTQRAMERLSAHNFPGNVRELCNVLQKAIAAAPEGLIRAEHIQFDSPAETAARAASPAPDALPANGKSLSQLESSHIATLLDAHQGNRRKVANALGISERTLYRKIKRYELDAARA
jgi:transcriptional regulator with PAS, ATPase and Fis domain